MYICFNMRSNLILIILFVINVSAKEKSKMKISEGKEVGGFVIGESEIKKVYDKFGKEEEFSRGVSCGTNSLYTNRFAFYKKNLVFISTTVVGSMKVNDLKKSIISNIGILHPEGAITDMGVNLKSDNYDKIIKLYGKPEKERIWKNCIDIHYYSKGISFECEINKKSIRKIEVYKKGGKPDLYYWRK